MQQQVHGTGISLRQLHVGKYNPRTTLHQGPDWEDFKASIAENGILQSLLVRPVEGKSTPYEIVAGQRRFLAAMEVFAPDYEPPILLKELTDAEAEIAAAAENIEREDMSPAEEAEAAARVLARCGGDRQEAAKRLGWSRANLDNRLRLMACSDKVRKTISERKIALGLAELMAGMTHAQQDTLLDQFLAKGMPTLDEAKTTIMALTKQLTTAIFDKAECGSCPQNSSRQQAMFGNIGEGHCLNAECFDRKTEAQLVATADALKDDYQIIKIVKPGDNYTLAKLDPAMVGETQAQACRNCASFGAAVSGLPNKLGQVSRGLCFDVACNKQKVKEHADAIAAAKAAEQQANAPAQDGSDAPTSGAATSGSPDAGQSTKGAKPKSETKGKAKDDGEVAVTLTTPVLEYRDKFYRGVVHAEYAVHPERNAQFVIALIIASKRFDGDKLKDGLKAKQMIGDVQAHSLTSSVKAAAALPLDRAKAILPQLGAVAVEALTRDDLKALVKESKADLGKYFNLATPAGKEFLKVLTKNQIGAIAEELGIAKAMGQTFRSLSAAKKDEFIESVTTVKDFDYQGKVPNVLKPGFSK